MRVYRVERFRADHVITGVRIGDTVLGMGERWFSQMMLLEEHPMVWSIMCAEAPGDKFRWVCSGGIVKLWKGVGEAWTVMGDHVEEHGLVVYRECRKALRAATIALELQRIQCTVNADKPRWIKFAEKLDFYWEGRLYRYGPEGKDYVMMARYTWDQ